MGAPMSTFTNIYANEMEYEFSNGVNNYRLETSPLSLYQGNKIIPTQSKFLKVLLVLERTTHEL